MPVVNKHITRFTITIKENDRASFSMDLATENLSKLDLFKEAQARVDLWSEGLTVDKIEIITQCWVDWWRE